MAPATYLVGGAVRDALLGLPERERDWVVVGSTPEALREEGFRQVGASFPMFIHPETGDEYALARRETKQGPGYRGFVIDAGRPAPRQQHHFLIHARPDAPVQHFLISGFGPALLPGNNRQFHASLGKAMPRFGVFARVRRGGALRPGDALRTEAASWPLGNCSVVAQRVTCQAATFAAQSSTTVSVNLNTVAVGNPNITVSLEANEPDIAPNDNTRSGRLEVREEKDDSGGGTTAPLFLLLLGLAALARRRV